MQRRNGCRLGIVNCLSLTQNTLTKLFVCFTARLMNRNFNHNSWADAKCYQTNLRKCLSQTRWKKITSTIQITWNHLTSCCVCVYICFVSMDQFVYRWASSQLFSSIKYCILWAMAGHKQFTKKDNRKVWLFIFIPTFRSIVLLWFLDRLARIVSRSTWNH